MIVAPTGQVGLDAREWKAAKMKMLETGEYDPNTANRLSDAQKYWVKETHKTIRSLKEKYETTT